MIPFEQSPYASGARPLDRDAIAFAFALHAWLDERVREVVDDYCAARGIPPRHCYAGEVRDGHLVVEQNAVAGATTHLIPFDLFAVARDERQRRMREGA